MSLFKHTQLRLKCLDCGLHFVICTQHPERHESPTCPECAGKGNFLCYREEVEEPIFATVPGNASAIALIPPG